MSTRDRDDVASAVLFAAFVVVGFLIATGLAYLLDTSGT